LPPQGIYLPEYVLLLIFLYRISLDEVDYRFIDSASHLKYEAGLNQPFITHHFIRQPWEAR